MIFRVSPDKLKDKVIWQKIAKKIEATYIPAQHYDNKLGKRKLIADTFLYFVIPGELGFELAGLLNSTPVRVYAASYVNRRGAVYCQYFAWIIALIPIPNKVVSFHAKGLERITKGLLSTKGKNKKLLERLDEEVAKLYGLSNKELLAMKEFLKFFVAG